MTDREPYKESIYSILDEWNRAEEYIKIAEQISEKVVFPSIKELRYAGRRLVEALHKIEIGEDYEDIKRYFDEAWFNCLRAQHDAVDAVTSKVAIDLALVKEKIGLDVALQVFPDYSKLVTIVNNIRKKIANSRKCRENREKIYEDIFDVNLKELAEIYHDFLECEPIMKEMAKSRRKKEFLNYLIGIVGLIIGVFGILLSILN